MNSLHHFIECCLVGFSTLQTRMSWSKNFSNDTEFWCRFMRFCKFKTAINHGSVGIVMIVTW